MKCIICGNQGVKKAIPNFPGYLNNTYFDIFYCLNCDTSFIDTKNLDHALYDLIYSKVSNLQIMSGYNRYLDYSKQVIKYKRPIEFLLTKESTYFPVYNYIKNKKSLKILEIGCGYGYLTYSLKELGHDVIGVDISEEAIKNAKNNFGNYFILGDLINNVSFEPNSFDLIIGTELIEHLPNIDHFIDKCCLLLKKNGEILLTTPNKDFSNGIPGGYWLTDNPPVHTCWLSKKSFKILSSKKGLKIKFLETRDMKNLHLYSLFYTYTKILLTAIFKSYKHPILEDTRYTKTWFQEFKNIILNNSVFIKFIKLTNKIYNKNFNLTLCVVLSK